MIFLSEYAHGERIAHVFKEHSRYCVEIFQRLQNQGRAYFPTEQLAEHYAENWVQGEQQ